MENIILRLVVSPALMGSIFLFVGYLTSKYPPKDFNRLYGYRTRKSMLNASTWKEANTYSSILMYKFGAIAFVFGVILSLIVHGIIVLAFTTIAFSIVLVSALIILTEKRLDQVFDNKGEKKI
jgi:uncharacterized membrane protein